MVTDDYDWGEDLTVSRLDAIRARDTTQRGEELDDDDWVDNYTYPDLVDADDPDEDITALFEVAAPKEVQPQEIVDAFERVAVGDLPSIFELFKTMQPPKNRIDRDLLDQQLRPILSKKGVKDAKSVIRDWFKVADEDGTLDAAVGVIPETVELPEGVQVDGRELLEDLRDYYRRFMHATEADFLTVALWNLMTHGVELFDIMALLCSARRTRPAANRRSWRCCSRRPTTRCRRRRSRVQGCSELSMRCIRAS